MTRSRLLLGCVCLGVAVALVAGRVETTVRTAEPKQVATEFLAAFLTGDLAAATSLSTAKTAPESREPLTAMSSTIDRIEPVGRQSVRVAGRLRQGEGAIPFRMRLVQQNGRWLVDAFDANGPSDQPGPVDTSALESIEGVEVAPL